MDDLATILSRDIVKGSQRAFERGRNLFPTSSVLASATLYLMNREKREAITSEANEAILRSLADQGAQALIYATVSNPGQKNEIQHADVVVVVTRKTGRTGMERHVPLEFADGVVMRGYTRNTSEDVVPELE